MDSIANGYGCRPCKIKQVQLDVTDAIIHFIGDGSALSNLNASNVAFGTLSTTVFPASGVTAGTYGSSSNISQITIDQYGRVTSAANVTSVSSQWTGLPGSSIYYIPGVSIGSSNDATANLQVTGNVYVSNSVTTTNVYATNYYGDGGLLSNVASQWSGTKGFPIYYIQGVSVGSSASATANLQVTGNVYVSNTVTVPNVHVTDTFDVTGSMTANASNATFFFDTFTIPYINTQYLNVSSNTTLTGNLVVATANIATLNVGYLTVNSAVVYGATTLNVYGTSNLTNVFATTLNVYGTSNLTNVFATTLNVYGTSNLTNVFATTLNVSNVIAIGPSPFTPLANLHVEQSNIFIGNSAITGSIQSTTGTMYRLVFDNTANTSVYPNKIVLYANTASSQYCGFGVTNLGPTGGASIAYGARQNHIFNTGSFLNTEIMRIAVGGTVGIGTASATAKLHVGTSLTQNVQVLVEASNVAIATTGGGRVGFGTSTPTSNLHVVGNIYASNSLTTTNVICTSVNSVNQLGFKNRIINGDFIIDQRNAGANTTPSTGLTRVIDRWKIEIAGSGRCLVGQNLLGIASPAGFTSYYGMQVSTTSTVNAGDYFFMSQVIEGINLVDLVWGQATAKPVTLSFWALSSITGTGGGFVRNAGETAGNYNRSFPFTYTINGANVWEYKTVAISGDTTGQWLSGQLDGAEVGFIMWNGSNFQATPGTWAAGNYTGPSGGTIGYAGSLNSRLFITGVQFESGQVATPFERRHIGYELTQCQRYYEPSIARLGGYNTTGNFLRSSVYFNTKKRPKTSPTFTVISTPESNNLGSLNFDNSNFDQSSARILAPVTATGDAYGQWNVAVDCEF